MSRKAYIAAVLRDLDLRSPAGCAIALHVRFSTPTFMFQTYPKRWLDHYSAKGLLMHDPVARWGLQNVGNIRWSALEAIDDRGVMEQARDFGLMNGVAIAIVSRGSRSIGGFARADREYDDEEIILMSQMLEALHDATEALSAAEREALTELSIRLTH
jgi:LuxR family transcriptional regulator